MTATTGMTGTVHVVLIDTLADLDTSAIPRTQSDNIRHQAERTTQHIDSHASWIGATTEQMTTALRDGWPEGAALVARLADGMRGTLPKPKSFKRKQQWTADGDEPSWERESAGYEDIWRTSKREQQYGPAPIEVMAPWGALGSVNADQLKWDGIVLVALTDLLEEAGYRVGATLNSAARAMNGHNYHLTSITVKRPEMPLDISSMVAVAAHPGIFRWHGLSSRTLAPFDCGWGFGSTLEIAQLPSQVVPSNVIVLRHAYTEQAARYEVERALALVIPVAA